MDAFRRPGRVPERFEAPGRAAGGMASAFAVRAPSADPGAVGTIRLLVLGLDPVPVCRREDCGLASHFGHRMDPEEEGPTP